MNNCLICNKPTHNKPNKNGDTLCSQQCIFIFDNRETLKGNYRKLSGEIEDLRDDIEYLMNKHKRKATPKTKKEK